MMNELDDDYVINFIGVSPDWVQPPSMQMDRMKCAVYRYFRLSSVRIALSVYRSTLFVYFN